MKSIRKRPVYPVDKIWKKTIRAAMRQRGLSQSKLASQIGVVPSAIVFLFGKAKSSTMVPAIHEALGFEPPAPPPPAVQAIKAA